MQDEMRFFAKLLAKLHTGKGHINNLDIDDRPAILQGGKHTINARYYTKDNLFKTSTFPVTGEVQSCTFDSTFDIKDGSQFYCHDIDIYLFKTVKTSNKGHNSIVPRGFEDLDAAIDWYDDLNMIPKGYSSLKQFEEVVEATEDYLNGSNINYLINEHKAGEYWKGVEYDILGFPMFEPFAVFKHQLDPSIYKKNAQEHMRDSTKALYDAIITGNVDRDIFTDTQFEQIKSFATRITDYTWHHSQKSGLMLLVPHKLHYNARHTGGNAIWGSGY